MKWSGVSSDFFRLKEPRSVIFCAYRWNKRRSIYRTTTFVTVPESTGQTNTVIQSCFPTTNFYINKTIRLLTTKFWLMFPYNKLLYKAVSLQQTFIQSCFPFLQLLSSASEFASGSMIHKDELKVWRWRINTWPGEWLDTYRTNRTLKNEGSICWQHKSRNKQIIRIKLIEIFPEICTHCTHILANSECANSLRGCLVWWILGY